MTVSTSWLGNPILDDSGLIVTTHSHSQNADHRIHRSQCSIIAQPRWTLPGKILWHSNRIQRFVHEILHRAWTGASGGQPVARHPAI